VIISIIIPVYNEETNIKQAYDRIQKVLTSVPFELLFVDDGSRDRSRRVIERLARADARVKLVALSRNFGHQVALTAGLQYAAGDAVVVMDADLQDPPELIPEMITLWQQGYDVVYGIRTQRPGETVLKRVTAHLFYRLLNLLSEVNIPMDVGDFRLMSRQVVDTLNAMPEYHRYLRGMVAWVGFRQVGIPYIREPRYNGHTHYSWKKMWHLSLDAITSFSVLPLRWVRRIALFVAIVALAASLWLIYFKLAHPHSLVLGWTSEIVTTLWLGALQLGVLGIMAEYLARVVEQGRRRPLFLVDKLANIDAGHTINKSREDINGAPRTMDQHHHSVL
jgi:glycosyltransferase involved in cell wall biosynthesis